jgi:hypothetical protein
MKALRNLCAALLLSGVLAMSVSAGDIHTGYVPPPPPPPTEPQPAGGQASEETGETGDALVDVIASLLNGLLTVL